MGEGKVEDNKERGSYGDNRMRSERYGVTII
jgi:hypothetical protein